MKPLTFYQQGAVAGMQQDQYSQAPWFVDSKNLDIFSSSQSVRATAWSEPELVDSNIVDVDHRGRFELHKNGKVRDRETSAYITDHDKFDQRKNKCRVPNTWQTFDLDFGEPKKLLVKYIKDEWSLITVITDRLIYNYYHDFYYSEMGVAKVENATAEIKNGDVVVKPLPWKTTFSVNILIKSNIFWAGFLRILWWPSGKTTIKSIKKSKITLIYNEQTKTFSEDVVEFENIPITDTNNLTSERYADIHDIFSNFYWNWWWAFQLEFNTNGGKNEEITIFEAVKESFEYLYPKTNRVIKKAEENLYITDNNTYFKYWYKKDRRRRQYMYDLLRIEEFFHEIDVKIIDCLNGVEQSILIANREDDGILYFMNDWGIGESAEWGIRSSYIYPGIEFLSFLKKDEFFYIIAKNRWIVGLYVRYAGKLKLLLSGENIKWETWDSINKNEQFRFSGLMCLWREHLILGTDDNRIFAYGENKGNNALTEIFSRSDIKKITDLRINKDQLQITYLGQDDQYYLVGLQDDRILKNYQSDFSITFPKQIGSHLLEKEPKELEISYMLPNKNCSLEVWLNVNDYHFRTYELEGEVRLTNGSYKIDGTDGEYQLKFIEKWENKLTFVLEGELPHQTEKKALKLIKLSWDWPEEIVAKSFDHFKYIGTIREEKFTHGKQRLVALTAEHNLPRARVLQVRVDWKTDWKSSPEIYSVHFTSEQIER